MATRTERASPCPRAADILAATLVRDGDRLRTQARRHAPAWADPDDALQDACLAFLRAYRGPPGERAARYLSVAVKRSAWALGTAAATRHAARVELTTTDAFDPETPPVRVLCERPGPTERAERRERVRDAALALAECKRDERTALVLFATGFSYAEIGALRGWSLRKVNRCIAEGRVALRAGGEFPPPGP
jgi:DNA-directed RNA polymerase specialized sigma24 family protein